MRKNNTNVLIYYEGRMSDGTVFDSRKEGDPLEVLLGSKKVPRGLENALFEMKVGEERVVHITPEEGYGSYEPDAVFKIATRDIENGEDLPVGEYIHWYGKNKKPAFARVTEKHDDYIVLDLNHPLADKEFDYWVKLVGEE